MHVTPKTMQIFSITHDLSPPTSDIRTQGPPGYVSALDTSRLAYWLILVTLLCLQSHNARYIMLKSLIIV